MTKLLLILTHFHWFILDIKASGFHWYTVEISCVHTFSIEFQFPNDWKIISDAADFAVLGVLLYKKARPQQHWAPDRATSDLIFITVIWVHFELVNLF